ncbi:MAG: protein kinase [Acidobacteriia bacterium]|nr:protein kinase [Terriglobia bacterium]
MGTANSIKMPNCPECGEQLGSGDPAGLCPKCLIAAAFESSVGADEFETHTLDAATALDGDEDFGRYRVLRPLGEGGMGTVYLAEQIEPLRRRVALKVVKLGMDTAQVLARFNNERQALAMMDHPNIAQIFDAGATTKGRPYFVMEYIEGAPITQYCDTKRMTTRERLALFLAVCRAVQHAHQKGVIHRDLKPSNVLVTEQDGAPVPKVIDFGIAKATDKWAVENTLLTQFGQIVGTPEYASPEQADTMTGDIDQASDVYSLGVLLYELLIGAVPFDTATLRNAGLAEMLRMIREDEAPSLPRKLTSMGAVASDIAARRQTDPASLRRLVDGDLNSIAMKALEKTRERRYASVAELAGDIQRHMENRPVLASPPGRLYRVRKFLRRHRLAALATVAGAVVLVLIGVTAWSLSHRDFAPRPKLTDKDTIVLADFDNKTGDPVFDDTLRQGLSVELQQSPFLEIISDQQLQQTLGLMGQPKDARLTPEIAQQVCERTGSAAILEGSITGLGSQYVLGLRAKNCNTGTVLDQEQIQAARREEVLNSLSQIARKFRTRVGESFVQVERHSTPLADATTASLDALKAYGTGMKVHYSGGQQAGIPFFRRAVEIDPKFAMAYAMLGQQYSAIGESLLSAESTTKAWQLRDRVSDREKYSIDFLYDRNVTGNLEKAYQTLESWYQTYPRGGDLPTAQGFLGGISTQGTGRFERAIEMAQKEIAVHPDISFAYGGLAFDYLFLDRFPEAETILQRASEHKVGNANHLVLRYNIAVIKGDKDEMDRVMALAKDKQGAEHRLAHANALALARSGRLQVAERLSNRAVDLALQEGGREEAASYRAARAVWEAVYGNGTEGKRSATAALELSRGRDVQYAIGLALAFSGDTSRSEELAGDLEKRFPEDTFVRFTYAPVLRAIAALARGKPAESVERLESAKQYELAANGLDHDHFYLGGLHSAYVRGEALVAEHHNAEAAAEFQKILDHRGIVGADPIGALAHLQLGRVFALLGEKAKAKAAYEAFLALWKDADPDVQILRTAKAEYGRL